MLAIKVKSLTFLIGCMNELKFNETEIEILKYLYEEFEKEKTDCHLYIITKAIKKATATALDDLRKLEKKGLIKSRPNPNIDPTNLDRKQPSRFYNLTNEGQAFGWAFLYTKNFVNLYKKSVRK
jgi:DNA-binding MarR family transcriptional regulator